MMVSTEHLKGILTICGGVLIHLSLGTLYTFGNINPYITSYMRYENSDSSLVYSKTGWIYQVEAIGQALLMIVGGVICRKIGPRWTTMIGGAILSFGVYLTYYAIKKSFAAVVFTYGALFGCGIGISYAAPISCAMEWFPSKKGFISGIIVAGFGSGAFIFDQVQTAFINPDNVKANVTVGPNDNKYFDQHELLERVPDVFILLACVYAAMNFVGSLLLSKPEPIREQRSEYTNLLNDTGSDEDISNDAVVVIENKHPMVILKTRAFWTLWFMFLVNGQAEQFAATLYKTFGQTFISDDRFLAIVGSFASVLNGLGRIFWGHLADRISFRRTMIIQCISMAFLFSTFALTEKGGKWMYFIWVCLIFGTFCGNFALFPVATAKAFGQKYFTVNYGMIFSSQLFTSVTAGFLNQNLSDTLGWLGIFLLVAGFSLLGLILVISFNEKKPNGDYI